jgi:hypothetical protein
MTRKPVEERAWNQLRDSTEVILLSNTLFRAEQNGSILQVFINKKMTCSTLVALAFIHLQIGIHIKVSRHLLFSRINKKDKVPLIVCLNEKW